MGRAQAATAHRGVRVDDRRGAVYPHPGRRRAMTKRLRSPATSQDVAFRLVLALGMVAVLGAVVGVTVLLPNALRPDPAGGDVAQQDDARGQSGSNALGSKLAGPDASASGPTATASPTSGGTSPSSGESSGPAGPSTGTPSATLITNEYAYHHEGAADAVRSPDWIVTSGSLFAVNGQLWS